MIGITILDRDERGQLKPTLRDLLTLLSETASRLSWSAAGVEASGTGAADLEGLAESGEIVTFGQLMNLADAVGQVIDGEFVGRSHDGGTTLLIRAVDSSAFDVEGPEHSVSAIEAAYRRTRRYS